MSATLPDWLSGDLTMNLLSEAIGILFTVLLVDRVLVWRRRRRWRHVRQGFLSVAQSRSRNLVHAWSDWLTGLAEKAREPSVAVIDSHGVRLTSPDRRLALEELLGRPLGSELATFAAQADGKKRRQAMRRLLPFLVEYLSADLGGLDSLSARLSVESEALSEQIGRFSGFVEPEPDLAFPVITLALSVSRLGVYETMVAPEHNRDELWDLSVRFLAEELVEGLEAVLSLHHHVERSLTVETASG